LTKTICLVAGPLDKASVYLAPFFLPHFWEDSLESLVVTCFPSL